MTAGTGKLKRNIADQVLSEIQAKIFPFPHTQVRKLMKDNLIFLRAVAFLQAKTANRLTDSMTQRRLELLGAVQQPDISQWMKAFNNRNQCHKSVPLFCSYYTITQTYL